VARYEAGRVPRLDVLRKISQLGGVTVGWLLQGQGGTPIVGRDEVSLSKGAPNLRARSILERLGARLAGNPHWPPPYRRRYEGRSAEILLRAIRELEEFRKLLDSTQTTASKKLGRQTKK